MNQKPIEDRFYNARTDPSLVVIEGFHPLKHAIRFGAELIEIVSPNLSELSALQAVYAPDITQAINGRVVTIPEDVFERLGPVKPPTGVMAIARRPNVDLTQLLADSSPAPVVLLENPRNLFNIGAAVRAAAAAGAVECDLGAAAPIQQLQRVHQQRGVGARQRAVHRGTSADRSGTVQICPSQPAPPTTRYGIQEPARAVVCGASA